VLRGDPRGAQLQTQIENLSAALHDWRRTRKYSQQTEERLAQITVQCARMVESWQQMDRRRNGPGAGVKDRREWAAERRVQPDTGDRIRALERTIEHEWEALADSADEPAEENHNGAVSADDNSATATNLTLRAFASTESRLAALEHDLQGRISQLSRDLQAVLAELRAGRVQAAPGGPSAFPLESVMRIHEELRDPGAAAPGALNPGPVRALPESTEAAMALTARIESLERAVTNTTTGAAASAAAWQPRYLLAALAAAVAGVAIFGLWMQNRVDARLNEAAVRVSAAEQQRDATVAATREEATRQVADARQSAAQAQTVGNVLAAPDRIRYWMTAANANSRAYAQLLVSRSRGIVFSASRLPPPGAGKTYQLWLVTRGGAVSAGLFTPDKAGRVTLADDRPLNLAGRISGPLVTLEPEGGSEKPSGQRVLIRVD
jgi:hypothetical protein